MDHCAGARSGRGADLLLFLRPEPLQAAHHLAPHAQAHYHAARRGPRRRTTRHSGRIPSAGHAARLYDSLRAALRQPDHPLYRRSVEDGGAAGRDRPRETPRPYPVLYLLRRPDGLPPARCVGCEGPGGGHGAHPLRRRGMQRCEKSVFRGYAPRRYRGVLLPARQIPAFYEQGQLPQSPQNRHCRRACGFHRRYEYRRPLCPGHGVGIVARHPFPDRRQRCGGITGVVPERLVGDHETEYLCRGLLSCGGTLYERYFADRAERSVR